MHNATEQKPIYRVVGVRRRRRGRGGMQGKARQGYPTYQPGNKIDLHVDYDSWWIIILPSNIVGGGGGGGQGTCTLFYFMRIASFDTRNDNNNNHKKETTALIVPLLLIHWSLNWRSTGLTLGSRQYIVLIGVELPSSIDNSG